MPPMSWIRLLVLHAELIDPVDGLLLTPLQRRACLPDAQREVHDVVREHLLHRHARRKTEAGRIDEQRLLRTEAEPFQIELVHIPVEAVLLRRVHRIELVDLHEREAVHHRTPRGVDPVLLTLLPDLRLVPPLQDPRHPFDEMLGGLAGRQRDHAFRVLQDPLDEPERRQLAEQREVVDLDDPDLFRRRIEERPAGLAQFK